jgi:hypothetical protein
MLTIPLTASRRTIRNVLMGAMLAAAAPAQVLVGSSTHAQTSPASGSGLHTQEKPGTGNPDAKPTQPSPAQSQAPQADKDWDSRQLEQQRDLARERLDQERPPDEQPLYVPPSTLSTQPVEEPAPSTGAPTISARLQNYIDDLDRIDAMLAEARKDGDYRAILQLEAMQTERLYIIGLFRTQGSQAVDQYLEKESRDVLYQMLKATADNGNTAITATSMALNNALPGGANAQPPLRLNRTPKQIRQMIDSIKARAGPTGTTPSRTSRNPDLMQGGVRPALPPEETTTPRTPRSPDLMQGGVRPALPPEETTPTRTSRNPDLMQGGERPALPGASASPASTPQIEMPPGARGVPGPGVTAKHLAAAQEAANKDGLTYVIHGSRQTGVRESTGTQFTPESDLDLGVVGGAKELSKALHSDGWKSVPDVTHEPMRIIPSEQEAIDQGFVIVRPTTGGAKISGGSPPQVMPPAPTSPASSPNASPIQMPPDARGIPGPGVSARHLAAVQEAANRDQATYVIYGSRQSGVRFRTGTPFTAESDLDLAIVGGKDEYGRVVRNESWKGIPDTKHMPLRLIPTEQEAIEKGYVIVRPSNAGTAVNEGGPAHNMANSGRMELGGPRAAPAVEKPGSSGANGSGTGRSQTLVDLNGSRSANANKRLQGPYDLKPTSVSRAAPSHATNHRADNLQAEPKSYPKVSTRSWVGSSQREPAAPGTNAPELQKSGQLTTAWTPTNQTSMLVHTNLQALRPNAAPVAAPTSWAKAPTSVFPVNVGAIRTSVMGITPTTRIQTMWAAPMSRMQPMWTGGLRR